MKSSFLALVLAMAVMGSHAQAAEEGDPARGHAFAKANCARCHAVGLKGASPLPEAPPFRTLPAKWPPENLAEALAEGIMVGHTSMPEFTLEPEEIDDFIAYLNVLGGE
ncbi:MAG: cytochrome c [Rhodospirillaceae bacterium]|jgi:cytochrome c|nr:cytochrome c [Rhodospirillaceae bacterium]MBT6117375.1 cytochrome c [Rhodospirillaceae bacterium]